MDEVKIQIEKYNQKGDGIGLLEGCRVEIPHALKGDTVIAQVTQKRKNRRKGRVESILEASPHRQQPLCPHSMMCGGCTWHCLDYQEELNMKTSFINDAFHFLDKPFENHPIISSPSLWNYRNKMEFSFSQNKANTKFLGLMIAKAQKYVFNLEDCHLAGTWFASVVKAVRGWWEKSNIRAYNPMDDSGSLRNLTLREGKKTQEKMIILTVSGRAEFAISKTDLDQFVNIIKETLQEEENKISIFLRIHQAVKGQPTQFFEMLLHGKDHIIEKIDLPHKSYQFKISPSSFFQPNTLQAEKLYTEACNLLKPIDPESVVYDLYCGTGTLSLAIASLVKEVIGIELNPYAICDAEINQELNNLKNITFLKGDVGQVLKDNPQLKKPDIVIVDPPRAGLDEKAMEEIRLLNPKIILYVSCNALTQSENVKNLLDLYDVKSMQPLDQFPHTLHCENIILLNRKASTKET
jgi:23S rRNA (uracil1939-C5)-methyltransferase